MTSRIRNFRPRQARRGVTLLLVLGLMTMFAMLVVTFMVVTTQAMRTSQSVAEVALKYDGTTTLASLASSSSGVAPTANFDPAIHTLLVGGLNTVIGPHSILENLYGHPDYEDSSNNKTKNLQGTAAANTMANSDLIEVDVTLDGDHDITGLPVDVTLYDYIGGILTVGDDNSAKSALIVNVELNSNGYDLVLHVAPVESTTTVADLSGTCYVNTPAFSGTGPGYDASGTGDALLIGKDDEITNGILSAGSGSGFELALRPNILAPSIDSSNNVYQHYKEYLEKTLVLMNPDYTAPDYQNMFLAWNEVTSTTGNFHTDSVIPSFHRPSLVRYWDNISTLTTEELRKIVLRPLRQDHPDFTGSNPATHYLPSETSNTDKLARETTFLMNGPWDVDNDGDGVQDGIWLDLGENPVEIGGTLYKPLYSFYVLDMDGRLNVNTHDSPEHPSGYAPTFSGNGADEQKDFGSLTGAKGTGSGVAEIRLSDGLNFISGSSNATSLMQGDGERTGRYGTDKEPGSENDADSSLGSSNWQDLARIMGIWYGAYATPSDNSYANGFGNLLPNFWGAAELLFDPLGNRKFDIDGPYFAQSPYMMNPYGDNISDANDSPFMGNDLEFIIRSVGDKSFHDVLLTTRLRHLIGSDNPNDAAKFSQYRHFVTTRSSDVPAPSRAGLDGYKGFFEYLVNELSTAQAENLSKLLPPELLRGEKVSLDRIMFLEASLSGNPQELLRQKVRFAQEMFYLIMALCHNEIKSPEDIARVAQWCVNLVDFLDTDDVMTPFVFHENLPLNNPYDLTDDTIFETFYPSDPATPASYTVPTGYRLIWGMEQPEVALTKTFATHNRRIADSKFGYDVAGVDISEENADIRKTLTHQCNSCGVHINRISSSCKCQEDPAVMHKHDDTYDQVMIPQGSLFLELYRVGNPNRTTSSFYTSGTNVLDMAKNNSYNNPMWRLAISKPAKTDAGNGSTSVEKQNDLFETAIKDDSIASNYTFQPQQWPNSPKDGNCDVELERFIWFGSTVPTDAAGADYNFTNFGSPGEVDDQLNVTQGGNTSTANAALEPNEYLVIGPRSFTSFKSVEFEDNVNEMFGKPTMATGSFIDLRKLNPNFDDDHPDADPSTGVSSFKSPKVMIAGAEKGVWNAGPLGPGLPMGIGVNVSEPKYGITYYDPPTDSAPTTATGTIKEQMGLDSATTFLDSYINDPTLCSVISNKEASFVQKSGTINRFRSVFLQRLANPDRPYHATTNPYITVDWNMIDLHVFNSEKDKASAAATPIAHGSDLEFAIRQWNCAVANSTSSRPNIWDRTFTTASDMDPSGEKVNNSFTGDLKAGVNFGRYSFGAIDSSTAENIDRLTSNALGDLPAEYVGAPKIAFLHFPWNNGPLSNTYELMLVPASSPSRFGFEFHEAGISSWWGQANSLGTDGKMSFYNPNPLCNIGPYFNFFNKNSSEPNLARLFDFVRVPSKFNGTIQGIAQDSLDGGSTTWSRPVYKMREPGKININTANKAAWDALQLDVPAADWLDYDTNLRDQKMEVMNSANPNYSNYPTEFLKPFRSAASGALVPPIKADSANSIEENDLVQSGSTSTPLNKNGSGPLFTPHEPVSGFADTTNKGTNQLTALENAMRRSDMITNRSNVFAVWVTIGYFEVQKYDATSAGITQLWTDHSTVQGNFPNATAGNAENIKFFNAVYPDGYVLGEEKGLTNGSVTRHRHFYLIDRTVPVGFRRGEKLNSQEVIVHDRRLD